MPKQGIHPNYQEAKFICTSCSHEFLSGSTKGAEVRVDTCSNCHPFYTGKQNFANAEGRVEKFKEKFAKKDAKQAEIKKASEAQKAENAKKSKDKK
ncbi:50S ribosomal protein L31 [Spiroplasma litorale]|uniref:Large ribosomal subunit protein bL31 n=1 Tax=Spiroplasma litorale TaxID=216942 RepID=A0A0K1W3C0_9MOLU|nr:50S ribosomal protein L31 [Spiroplasma litorale]